MTETAHDARWRTFPDATDWHPPTAGEVEAARATLGRSLARGWVFVGIAIVLGIVARNVSPPIFVVAFLLLVLAGLGWNWRHRRAVQAGFLQWCAARGLTHSMGNVSPGYPMPAAPREHASPATVVGEFVEGRARIGCQVVGRLWEASSAGTISTVRVRQHGRDAEREFLVVDVPADATLLANGDADAQVAEDGSGWVVRDGRWYAWSPSSSAFFATGVAVAATSGSMRSAGGHAGADVLLDGVVAAARDRYRRLVEGG